MSDAENTPPRRDSRDAGSESGFEELFKGFSPDLERIAWVILRDWQLAADAVQETFALFAEKHTGIELGQQKGWLVVTVQHQALNLRRKQKTQTQHITRQSVDAMAESIAEEDQNKKFEIEEEVSQVLERVQYLPVEQRQILEMRFRRELKFKTIAAELEIPLGTVLSRFRLAIQKLRSELNDSVGNSNE